MAIGYIRTNFPRDSLGKLLIALLAIIGAFQLFMVFRFEVNQDEFYSLNMIYEFVRGEVHTPFQTIFLRLFGWLQYVPGYEVDKIVVGRLVVGICGLVTATLIYKTSRRFASVNASLFAVLVYFSFFYVFRHFTAFRVDGVITALLMAAVYVSTDPRPRWTRVIFAGAFIGMACMITLKSVFYLPIIAVFLLRNWAISGWKSRAFLQGLAMAIMSILTFFALYLWHGQMATTAQPDIGFLKEISGKSFFAGGFLNRSNALLTSLLFNPVGWCLVLAGFLTVCLDRLKSSKASDPALLICILPLSTVLFYFHANPYYYIFIMAPAVLYAAVFADRFLVKKREPLTLILIALLSVMLIRTAVQSVRQTQTDQRVVIKAAHSLFPFPVNVIDYCGMMSSFNRVNETGWFINPDIFAMERYYQTGPVLNTVLPQYKPELIIANVNGLDLENAYEHQFDAPLLGPDTHTLREHYTRIWGPLYVPGQTLDKDGTFSILVPGLYTVKSKSELRINGELLTSGDVVDVAIGTHDIALLSNASAQLIWGDNLKRPDFPEPKKALFNGF